MVCHQESTSSLDTTFTGRSGRTTISRTFTAYEQYQQTPHIKNSSPKLDVLVNFEVELQIGQKLSITYTRTYSVYRHPGSIFQSATWNARSN